MGKDEESNRETSSNTTFGVHMLSRLRKQNPERVARKRSQEQTLRNLQKVQEWAALGTSGRVEDRGLR